MRRAALASLLVVAACAGDDQADPVGSATSTPPAQVTSPPSDETTDDAAADDDPDDDTIDGESASNGPATTSTEAPTERRRRRGNVRPAVGSVTTAPGTTIVPNEREGMPPVLDATNVYSATTADDLSPAVADARELVYVPTNDAGNVTVIDQRTFEVVDEYVVGELAQHVTPSWDLTTLYANASGLNQLVPIEPSTGRPGDPIPVDAPYNLYFTPDGEYGVVMAERRNRIDFYDPDTWERDFWIDTPCDGPNHADWSTDGQSFWVTCEFSSQLLRLSTDGAMLGMIDLPGGKPQDVRLLPDGSAFYVADMANAEVLVLHPETGKILQTIETGEHPHGIYPSRDGRRFYVSNRVSGSVSVVNWRRNKVVDTWVIPGGGSPDMGGVSADGSVLWLSGRFHDEVYAFDTETGELLARIPVAGGPHGLAVWPQPGRYSLGHTGNLR